MTRRLRSPPHSAELFVRCGPPKSPPRRPTRPLGSSSGGPSPFSAAAGCVERACLPAARPPLPRPHLSPSLRARACPAPTPPASAAIFALNPRGTDAPPLLPRPPCRRAREGDKRSLSRFSGTKSVRSWPVEAAKLPTGLFLARSPRAGRRAGTRRRRGGSTKLTPLLRNSLYLGSGGRPGRPRYLVCTSGLARTRSCGWQATGPVARDPSQSRLDRFRLASALLWFLAIVISAVDLWL